MTRSQQQQDKRFIFCYDGRILLKLCAEYMFTKIDDLYMNNIIFSDHNDKTVITHTKVIKCN